MFMFGEIASPVLKYSFLIKKLDLEGPNKLNSIFFPQPPKSKKEDYGKNGKNWKESQYSKNSKNVKSFFTKSNKGKEDGKKSEKAKGSMGIQAFFKKVEKK